MSRERRNDIITMPQKSTPQTCQTLTFCAEDSLVRHFQSLAEESFDDTRGTLFFEIARLVKSKRPSYLLLENVPGLLSHDKGRTFSVILATLNDLGYRVEWMVLNSADFRVPQVRKRAFIVGYLDPRCAGKILPVFGTDGKALIQVLGGPQGSRVYDPRGPPVHRLPEVEEKE